MPPYVYSKLDADAANLALSASASVGPWRGGGGGLRLKRLPGGHLRLQASPGLGLRTAASF